MAAGALALVVAAVFRTSHPWDDHQSDPPASLLAASIGGGVGGSEPDCRRFALGSP